MIDSEKIILDLCAGTGAWSLPYREAIDINGVPIYDVRLVTLPEYDVRTYIPPANVYGILAAPPCTMFSLARTKAKTPRNFKEGMEVVKACLNIIWQCRYKNKLAFWALENPMGYLRQFLGKPAFTFQPFEFGEHYSKRTDIWGYFNIPKKHYVNLNQLNIDDFKRHTKQNSRKLPLISDFTVSKQAARRAITPPGFAKAFFGANR